MVMSAKFAGRCRKCGGSIHVGDRIEWSKGEGASHATCPSSTSAKPAAKPRTASALPALEAAPWAAFEKWEPCKRIHLHSAIGETRRYASKAPPSPPLRKGATAEYPSHGVYVVVAQTERWESEDDADDFGGCDGAGWLVTLYLRAATAEEVEKDMRKRLEAGLPAVFRALGELLDRIALARIDGAIQAAINAGTHARTVVPFGIELALALSGATVGEKQVFAKRLTSSGALNSARYRTEVTLADGAVAWIERAYDYDWDHETTLVAPLSVAEPFLVAAALTSAAWALRS